MTGFSLWFRKRSDNRPRLSNRQIQILANLLGREPCSKHIFVWIRIHRLKGFSGLEIIYTSSKPRNLNLRKRSDNRPRLSNRQICTVGKLARVVFVLNTIFRIWKDGKNIFTWIFNDKNLWINQLPSRGMNVRRNTATTPEKALRATYG